MLNAFFSLGKYIAYSVKLPDLGQKHKRGNSGLVLGDLEEALVPYYASASKQVLPTLLCGSFHCRETFFMRFFTVRHFYFAGLLLPAVDLD